MSHGCRNWKRRIIFNLEPFLPPPLRFCFYFGGRKALKPFPRVCLLRNCPFTLSTILPHLRPCLGLSERVSPHFHTGNDLYLSAKERGHGDDEDCVPHHQQLSPVINTQRLWRWRSQLSSCGFSPGFTFIWSLQSATYIKAMGTPCFRFSSFPLPVPHSSEARWEIIGATAGIWEI